MKFFYTSISKCEIFLKRLIRALLFFLSRVRVNIKSKSFSDLSKRVGTVLSRRKKRKKKTILHFVCVFSRPSETFIYDLLLSLEKEAELDNFILFDQRELKNERPYEKAIFIPWDDLENIDRGKIYKIIFRDLNPDVVVAHFALNEWILSRRLRSLGIRIPIIAMTHGIDVFSLKSNQEYKNYILENFCKKEDTHFTVPSNYLRDNLKANGVPDQKISTVHNAVSDLFFEHRKKNNFYDQKRQLKILAIGRLIEVKGHSYLLDGVHYFKKNCYKNVHLAIVYAKEKKLLAKTIEKIKNLGLEDNVTLIPFVDFSKNRDFIQSFDIFVHPSTYTTDKLRRSESFGIAALEAIASGLPVVVTNAGGLPEVVGKPNKFAKIVAHGNGLAIGRGLQELFEDGTCFSDNIEYAKERLELFSRKRQVSLLAKEISRVCGT